MLGMPVVCTITFRKCTIVTTLTQRIFENKKKKKNIERQQQQQETKKCIESCVTNRLLFGKRQSYSHIVNFV